LLQGQLAAVDASTPTVRAYRALAVGEAARATREPADWGEAVSVCRSSREPYLLAYALFRYADDACAAGERENATAPLLEAARLAEMVGAAPLLDDVRLLARRARIKLDSGDEFYFLCLVLAVASTLLIQRDFDNASRAFDATRSRTHDKDEQKFLTFAIGDLATIKAR